MARTYGAFEQRAERSGVDADDRLAVRVDHLHPRGEDEVDALLRAQLGVPLEVARVAREVLPGGELQRVHEDRDGQVPLRPDTGARVTQQAGVTRVQRAHREHRRARGARGKGLVRRLQRLRAS